MKLRFKKMNGAGNDFVIVDNLKGGVSLTPQQIEHVCDRRRGVGADGLILVETDREHDFFMRFYNNDGGEAEMCGNGSRCSAAFAASLGLGVTTGGVTKMRFQTGSGPITAEVEGECVRMSMMDARDMRTDLSVRVAQESKKVHFMVVGTRHVVVPVADVASLTVNEINALGGELRNHPEFGPVGANVNFASIAPDGRIHIRTYEKGVEAETHACGTGSVASAVLLAHKGQIESPAKVVQRGGEELMVSFQTCSGGAGDVVLEGPVAVNFEGVIRI